ncbi:hypothetical protein [Paenibacillus sp. IITD108]|uniref:hypothetical protein n=1 Tax=Paenibacillus sp. IITD108 TaxID=3116649 RepID=UPI002F42CB29
MQREEILNTLLSRLGNGLWILAVLKKEGRPINKERLGVLTNELYHKAMAQTNEPVTSDLIGSRHTLDQLTAQLYGAGLVDTPDLPGRATFYTLSSLGKELIDYRESIK